MNWYAIAYGFGSAILIYFILRLYRSAPDTEAKFYFMLMSVAAAIWIISEFLYYLLWGPLSLVFYFVKYVGIIFTPYAVLMSALTTPIRHRVMKFRYTPHLLLIPPLISLAFLVTDPLHHLFFSGFETIQVGDGLTRYTGHWGPIADYLHVPYSYVCLISALVVLILNIRKSRTKIDYHLLTTLFVAILAPVVMNVVQVVLWDIYPDPTSLTIVFSAALMSYSLSKYKLFNLPMVTAPEEAKEERIKDMPTIEPGRSYLVRGDGYEILRNIVSSKPTLIIDTRNPRWIKDYFGSDSVTAIWLSEVDTKESILPERLEFEIEYTAIEFWRQNPGGYVVLGGIGYLRAFNSMDRLLMFLKDLSDVSAQYDGVLLAIDCDLHILDEEERKSLEMPFDTRIERGKCPKYGIFIRSDDFGKKVVCISPENPDKVCPNAGIKIWVRRGGKYTPEGMRIEVLYEIEKAMDEGHDLVINKPDELFIGWKPMKIYAYLKLLADSAEKRGRRVYILGEEVRKEVWDIINLFL